jgi:hypothetical protein
MRGLAVNNLLVLSSFLPASPGKKDGGIRVPRQAIRCGPTRREYAPLLSVPSLAQHQSRRAPYFRQFPCFVISGVLLNAPDAEPTAISRERTAPEPILIRAGTTTDTNRYDTCILYNSKNKKRTRQQAPLIRHDGGQERHGRPNARELPPSHHHRSRFPAWFNFVPGRSYV